MNIIFLGPPGSGKGTQSKNIEKKYNITQLSTGEILRSVSKSETDLGRKIRNTMNEGSLVSDKILIDLIDQKINTFGNGFLLDGFPRTKFQAQSLDIMLKKNSKSIDHVIEIQVDQNILLKRIIGRYMCSNCSKGYHDIFQRPLHRGICDSCGKNKFERRSDDNRKNAILRIQTYFKNTAPLIPYYKSMGKLRIVDGTNEINKITQNIENVTGLKRYAL